ncbi:dynamin-1-like protein [Yasminevirus sp. GU-2018]|uniref:Dynamin-1-like protein n=1 Tax=Yasminevirus sp. GU-2018 TaxID=2420051 RepID=A0A5K0UAH8_9VIRU|nr:dynamin-1-like protein [Yasminevirus sp. GU-2018]
MFRVNVESHRGSLRDSFMNKRPNMSRDEHSAQGSDVSDQFEMSDDSEEVVAHDVKSRFKRQKMNQMEVSKRFGNSETDSQKGCMTSYIYSGIVSDLTNLKKLSSNFTMKLHTTLRKATDEITSLGPQIVVFGQRGCGKTTLLQKLFNLPGTPGEETIIPVEFRFSPGNYCAEMIKIIFDSKSKPTDPSIVFQAKTFPCTTELPFRVVFDQALAYLKENYYPSDEQCETKIVCNLYGENCFSVVDLPGVGLSSTSLSTQSATATSDCCQYYTSPPSTYMNAKNTLVLHVVRADVDARLDLSLKLAQDCNLQFKNVVTVLTHADKLQFSRDKAVRISGLHDSMKERTVLVSNTDKQTISDSSFMYQNYGTKGKSIMFGENAIHREISIFVERYLPTITKSVSESLDAVRLCMWSEMSGTISDKVSHQESSQDGTFRTGLHSQEQTQAQPRSAISNEKEWASVSRRWETFNILTNQCAKIMELVEVASQL